jgi:hypothetical protein
VDLDVNACRQCFGCTIRLVNGRAHTGNCSVPEGLAPIRGSHATRAQRPASQEGFVDHEDESALSAMDDVALLSHHECSDQLGPRRWSIIARRISQALHTDVSRYERMQLVATAKRSYRATFLRAFPQRRGEKIWCQGHKVTNEMCTHGMDGRPLAIYYGDAGSESRYLELDHLFQFESTVAEYLEQRRAAGAAFEAAWTFGIASPQEFLRRWFSMAELRFRCWECHTSTRTLPKLPSDPAMDDNSDEESDSQPSPEY